MSQLSTLLPLRHSLLSGAEEADLMRRVAEGDQSARDRVVLLNLRLVVGISKYYQNRGLSLEDLVEEGILGLFEALDRYQLSKGYRLASYAPFRIRHSIQAALRAMDKDVDSRGGSTRIVVTKDKTVSRKKCPGRLQQVPLDESHFAGVDETRVEDADEVEVVRALMDDLCFGERQVLRVRFGIEDGQYKSLQQVADSLGFSKERARFLQNRGIARIRKRLVLGLTRKPMS